MGRINRFIFEVDEKLFKEDNLFKALNYLLDKSGVPKDKLNLSDLNSSLMLTDNSRNENHLFAVFKEGATLESIEKCNLCTRNVKFTFEYGDATYSTPLSDESTYFDNENKCIVVSYELFENYDERGKNEICPTILSFLNENKYLKRNIGFRMNAKPITLREDDAQLLIDIFDLNKTITYPILIVKENNEEIREISNKMQGLVTVFVNEDDDILEEINQKNCKHKDNLLEVLLSNAVCILPALPDTDGISFAGFSTVKEAISRIDCYYNNILDSENRDCSNASAHTLEKQFLDYKSTVQAIVDKYRFLEKDNENLKKKLGTLINEKTSKNSPVYVQKDIMDLSRCMLLKMDDPSELYQDEKLDMIMECLKDYRKNYVKDGTRRADILDDVIKSTKTTGIISKKRKEIDEKMNDFESGTSPKSKRILEDLGFKVKIGSHVKVMWQCNDKYTDIVASTPSDKNAKKVIAREFKEKFL